MSLDASAGTGAAESLNRLLLETLCVSLLLQGAEGEEERR